MLLYAKALLKVSCHVFELFQEAGDIKTPEHVRLLTTFSSYLQKRIYGKCVADCEMPVEIDTIQFSMARIDAEKQTFVKEKLLTNDKYWQRRLIRDFGIKVHKSIFANK